MKTTMSMFGIIAALFVFVCFNASSEEAKAKAEKKGDTTAVAKELVKGTVEVTKKDNKVEKITVKTEKETLTVVIDDASVKMLEALDKQMAEIEGSVKDGKLTVKAAKVVKDTKAAKDPKAAKEDKPAPAAK